MSVVPIIIDLETTDVDLDKASICQMAAVAMDLDTGTAHTLISTYCNPGVPISPGATEVHGIKDEDVVWSPAVVWTLHQLKLVMDDIESNGQDIVICGQNHERFDIPIMKRILPSAGFESYLSVDTYTIAIREHPSMPHTLGEFYAWYCEKPTLQAHDAAADCHMVAGILSKYMADTGKTILEIAAEQEQPKVLSHFPFGKYKGKAMSDISLSYIQWCRGNFKDTHKDVEATICDFLGCDEWVVHP